jgi:hypothetical protein
MSTDTVAISAREAELEERLRLNAFDSDAWEEIANLALQGKNPTRVRSVMTRLLERYPFASWEWVRYLEFEQSQKDDVRRS